MERGIGDTRKLTVGAAGRCRIRGDPETHQQAMLEERGLGGTRSFTPPGPLKDAGLEETRRTIAGTAGRSRNRGDPGNHREAKLEAESWGNLELRRRQSRRMRDSRKLDEPSPAPGRCRIRGNPKTHRKAMLKVEEPGKPGDATGGGAEGCGIRGNSMNHRRKSRKVQDSGRPEGCIERRGRTVENAGKPGDLQPAAPKDADSRKLEKPIAGTAWRHGRRGNSQPGQRG
jgi:hypothetical protein